MDEGRTYCCATAVDQDRRLILRRLRGSRHVQGLVHALTDGNNTNAQCCAFLERHCARVSVVTSLKACPLPCFAQGSCCKYQVKDPYSQLSGSLIATSPFTMQYSPNDPSSGCTAFVPCVKPATRSPFSNDLETSSPISTTVPAKSQPTVAPAVGMPLMCFQSARISDSQRVTRSG